MPTTIVGSNFRCVLSYASAGYQTEGFMQRSFDGSVLVFPCNDLSPGVAVPPNITGRVIAILRADGTIDTSTRISTAFRDSTTATLFLPCQRRPEISQVPSITSL